MKNGPSLANGCLILLTLMLPLNAQAEVADLVDYSYLLEAGGKIPLDDGTPTTPNPDEGGGNNTGGGPSPSGPVECLRDALLDFVMDVKSEPPENYVNDTQEATGRHKGRVEAFLIAAQKCVAAPCIPHFEAYDTGVDFGFDGLNSFWVKVPGVGPAPDSNLVAPGAWYAGFARSGPCPV